jgi:hypothetical protein
MKYYVKTTYTAKANHPHEKEGTQQVWYTGKGESLTQREEYITREICGCCGWSRKHFAEKYINDCKIWENNVNGDVWDIKREILTY